MLNFTVTVEGEEPTPNREIDSYSWFSPEDAKANIKRNSLAQRFLNWYLDGGEF
jgi:NAD+ diphosphatase